MQMFTECPDCVFSDVAFNVIWPNLLYPNLRMGLKTELNVVFFSTGDKEMNRGWELTKKVKGASSILTFIQCVNNDYYIFTTRCELDDDFGQWYLIN